MNTSRLEAFFILGFGVFHFAIPFLLPPNYNAPTLFGLQIADFVLPGCFLLAASAIAFFASKNPFCGGLLVFLYCGGITFHILYLSGLFPSVLVVPTRLLLVGGIVLDALSIFVVVDYYRRVHVAAV